MIKMINGKFKNEAPTSAERSSGPAGHMVRQQALGVGGCICSSAGWEMGVNGNNRRDPQRPAEIAEGEPG